MELISELFMIDLRQQSVAQRKQYYTVRTTLRHTSYCENTKTQTLLSFHFSEHRGSGDTDVLAHYTESVTERHGTKQDRDNLMPRTGTREWRCEMKDSAAAESERERVSHINRVRGDLTRPPLNTEHRKATLKPVEIYLYSPCLSLSSPCSPRSFSLSLVSPDIIM